MSDIVLVVWSENIAISGAVGPPVILSVQAGGLNAASLLGVTITPEKAGALFPIEWRK